MCFLYLFTTFVCHMNTFIPHPELWLKWYPCCSSTRMILVLNNPRRLIYHKTKKPNQILLAALVLLSTLIFLQTCNIVFIVNWTIHLKRSFICFQKLRWIYLLTNQLPTSQNWIFKFSIQVIFISFHFILFYSFMFCYYKIVFHIFFVCYTSCYLFTIFKNRTTNQKSFRSECFSLLISVQLLYMYCR